MRPEEVYELYCRAIGIFHCSLIELRKLPVFMIQDVVAMDLARQFALPVQATAGAEEKSRYTYQDNITERPGAHGQIIKSRSRVIPFSDIMENEELMNSLQAEISQAGKKKKVG